MPEPDELTKLCNDEEFKKELILIATKYFKEADQFPVLVEEIMVFTANEMKEVIRETRDLRKLFTDQMHDRLRRKLMTDTDYTETLERKAKGLLFKKEYCKDAVADTQQAMFVKRVDELKKVEKHMQGYVYSILKFICIGKNKEEGWHELPDGNAEPPEDKEPRSLEDLNECLDKLHASLKAVSPRDAQIFKMLREDYDNEEIAEALGISHGTARVAIYRLRQQIKGKCREDADS